MCVCVWQDEHSLTLPAVGALALHNLRHFQFIGKCRQDPNPLSLKPPSWTRSLSYTGRQPQATIHALAAMAHLMLFLFVYFVYFTLVFFYYFNACALYFLLKSLTQLTVITGPPSSSASTSSLLVTQFIRKAFSVKERHTDTHTHTQRKAAAKSNGPRA